MQWGYLAIGVCIGMVIGAFAAGYVALKDSSIRGMAMTVQSYCSERDCFECEFMGEDGECRLRTPVTWPIDEESDE